MHWLTVTVLTVLLSTVSAGNTTAAAGTRTHDDYGTNPVEVDIHLEKKMFAVDERIEGEVRITSTYPATFPVNFTVIVYRNNRFHRRSIVNTPVFTGTTSLGLETFGLQDILTPPHAPARWRVEIKTGGRNPAGAAVAFSVKTQKAPPPRQPARGYIYGTEPNTP